MKISNLFTQALGLTQERPRLGRPERASQNAPTEVDTGPPGTGAPPPKAETGVQKEVDANEPKPQAQILDLLNEIFPMEAPAENGGAVGLTHKKSNLTRAVAVRIGDIKPQFNADSVMQVLAGLGIQVPAEIQPQDLKQLRTGIADKIVTEGLPPNLRGLLFRALKLLVPTQPSLTEGGDVAETPTTPPASEIDNTEGIESPVETSDEVVVADTSGDTPALQNGETLGADETILPVDGEPTPFIGDVTTDIEHGSVEPVNGSATPTVGDENLQPADGDGSLHISDLAVPTLLATDEPAAALQAGSGSVSVSVLGKPVPLIEAPNPQPVPTSELLSINQTLSDLDVVSVESVEAPQAIASTSGETVAASRTVTKEPASSPNLDSARPFAKKEVRRPIHIDSIALSNRKLNDVIVPKPRVDVADVETNENETSYAEVPNVFDIQTAKNVGLKVKEVIFDVKAAETTESPTETIEAELPTQASDVAGTKTSTYRIAPGEKHDLSTQHGALIRERVLDTLHELLSTRGHSRTVIRLQPDDLGTVTVEIRSYGQNVDARINASDDRVRASLTHQRGELVQGVESRGLQLDNFSVGKDSAQDAHGFGRGNAQSQNQATRQDFARAVVLGTPRAETAASKANRHDIKFRSSGLDTIA